MATSVSAVGGGLYWTREGDKAPCNLVAVAASTLSFFYYQCAKKHSFYFSAFDVVVTLFLLCPKGERKNPCAEKKEGEREHKFEF